MSGAAQAASATSPLRARDLLAALVVVILWGVNFVAMKWGLRSFSPFQLGAARAGAPGPLGLRAPHRSLKPRRASLPSWLKIPDIGPPLSHCKIAAICNLSRSHILISATLLGFDIWA